MHCGLRILDFRFAICLDMTNLDPEQHLIEHLAILHQDDMEDRTFHMRWLVGFHHSIGFYNNEPC